VAAPPHLFPATWTTARCWWTARAAPPDSAGSGCQRTGTAGARGAAPGRRAAPAARCSLLGRGARRAQWRGPRGRAGRRARPPGTGACSSAKRFFTNTISMKSRTLLTVLRGAAMVGACMPRLGAGPAGGRRAGAAPVCRLWQVARAPLGQIPGQSNLRMRCDLSLPRTGRATSAQEGSRSTRAHRPLQRPAVRANPATHGGRTAFPPSSIARISSGLKVAILMPLQRWLNCRLRPGSARASVRLDNALLAQAATGLYRRGRTGRRCSWCRRTC